LILSKREKYIVAAAIIAVAILLLDRLVLTPVWDRKTVMESETQRVLTELDHARLLFERRRQLSARWQEMLNAGLNADPDAAVGLVSRAVYGYSDEAGLSVSSLRPERLPQRGDLQETAFPVSATGPMSAVAGFLWRIENSTLPIRIRELQLGTRKEGTDDLTLQLRISALCQASAPQAQPPKTTVASRTEENGND
jgi:hypothetical protein